MVGRRLRPRPPVRIPAVRYLRSRAAAARQAGQVRSLRPWPMARNPYPRGRSTAARRRRAPDAPGTPSRRSARLVVRTPVEPDSKYRQRSRTDLNRPGRLCGRLRLRRPGACGRKVGVLPRTRRRSFHASRNLSRAPAASLRDRLRRPLTEPACRQLRQLSGSGEGPGTRQCAVADGRRMSAAPGAYAGKAAAAAALNRMDSARSAWEDRARVVLQRGEQTWRPLQ